MRKSLTLKDIKELRYQSRSGYIISAIFFMIGTLISILIYVVNHRTEEVGVDTSIILAITSVFASLALIMCYMINRNYISDIRNNEKEIEVKIIERKMLKGDLEGGSETIGGEIKAVCVYSIVVEGYKYMVEEDFYDKCKEGGEVLFNYAPISRHLISMDLEERY